jgi:hypothetical protein
VRAAIRGVSRGVVFVAGSSILAFRWLGREAKEVTLITGFGLLFAGLARVDVTIALIAVGGLLVRLAWPTPPPPAPSGATVGSPHTQPTGPR